MTGTARIFFWMRAVLISFFLTGAAVAQTSVVPISPIVTIESDRLFSGSAFGLRVAAEIEAERSVLLAENRKIEAELLAEEKRLTDLRKEMDPKDFRAIADAFDARVEGIRTNWESKARAISEKEERERAMFLQAAQPVLVDLMREARAGMILERRSVFLSADATDITDLAINRLNLAIGDGSSLPAEE